MSTTAPKVLDRIGRPLSVGSRVNGDGKLNGEVVEMDGLIVKVRWPTARYPLPFAYSVDLMWRTPDLELIDQYDKEESR